MRRTVAAIRLIAARLAALMRRDRLDRELQDELDVHVSLAADEFIRKGASPGEARRLARVALGGRDAAMEAHRDARSWPALGILRQDSRYALRTFRRSPGFSLLAILILALGIGANTAIFSIVNAVVLRPLPLSDPDQLTWIANTGSRSASGVTYRVDWYDEFKRHSTSFADIGAYFAFSSFLSRTLTGPGDPTHLKVIDIAPGFFEVLGVEPAAGRVFLDDEHRGPTMRAAILTHGYWQRRFGGDPAIVGQPITINNTAVPVVGIMPASFDFASIFMPGAEVDLFLPADLDQMRPWGNTLALVGRRRAGVTLGQAQSEFAALLPRLREAHPDWGGVGAALTDLRSTVNGSVRRSLFVLWGAVGFVLLIVCANVTNLLLARASGRRREFALRGALGAGRRRLMQQVLTEGVMLAGSGALLGIPLAYGLTTWLTQRGTGSGALSIPLLHYAHVDTTALALTAAVACLVGIVGAAVPALRLSAQAPQTALSDQNRGTTEAAGQAWWRRGLVVAQIAVATTLLTGAGLLGRSFVELLGVDLGFSPGRAAAARIDLPALPPPERAAMIGGLLERVANAPGVDGVGLTDALPLDRNRTWGIGIPGRTYGPGEYPTTFVYFVTAGYLPAMDIAIRAGREFIPDDPMADRSPAIINETLARTLYPNEDPIGRPAETGGRPLTIVGVVADVRQGSLDEPPVNQLYLDMTRGDGVLGGDLIVRSDLAPRTLAPMLRGVLAEVDSRLLVTDVRPLDALINRSVAPRRFFVQLIGGFSALALLLASLGVYGVVSYQVSQRTAEFGVRMALGATGAEVRRRVLTDTLALSAAGIAIGGLAAWLIAGALSALLYATSPTDPVVFGLTMLTLFVVAMVAGWIPALRASRIDPARALRAD